MSSLYSVSSKTDYFVKFAEKNGEKQFEEEMNGSSTSNNIATKDVDRLIKTYGLGSSTEDKLTISGMKEEILSLIDKHPVVIIRGPTGCGKTTRVPRYILDKSFETKVGCNIIVTQPRRIAATSIAQRFCKERKWTLPSIVGYQIGQDNCTADDTRLTFCTTGVLLNQVVKQKNLNAYTHIIIDEVHERDQDTDFLLLIVKTLLRSNSKSVKVILMSATIDADKFSDYFSFDVENNLVKAPVFDIVKMNVFKIRTYYLDEISEINAQADINPSQEMFDGCKRLIASFDREDRQQNFLSDDLNLPSVLVFLPGSYEMEELEKILLDYNDKTWEVSILHSTTSKEDREYMFEPIAGKRHIILATNIAESSVTVPNVKYVIDFCLMKLLVTDPITNFQYLQSAWASRANCQQRAGRTGRVMDGVVYRLVRKYYYDKLSEESPPEMLRIPLTNIILKSKILDLGKPEILLAGALNPPSTTNIKKSILVLKESGALTSVENDTCDGELTDLGRVMAELPVDVCISRMIVIGYIFSVLPDALIMAAGVAARSTFVAPYKKKFDAYKAKLYWAKNTESDVIAFRNVYLEWKKKKAVWRAEENELEENIWARKNFVEVKSLDEVEASIEEWEARLQKLGIKEDPEKTNIIWSDDQKLLVLKTVIAGAFYPNYFATQPRSGNERTRDMVFSEPKQTVMLNGWISGQPGMLYAKRIHDLFANCLTTPTEKISIKFDNFKHVFVKFDETGYNFTADELENQKIGEVSRSVYHAIKMGLIGRKIKIPVTHSFSSSQLAQQKGVSNNPQHFTSSFVVPPNKENCVSNVELKGPFSPLQLEPVILTNAGKNMKVTTDIFSVNSILLDPSVKCHQPRLLVATNVSTSKSQRNRTSQLSARNTTLMPNIPGLKSLFSLIFAPQVELKCDILNTKNIGVLCGLGYDPKTRVSLFPEHDMAVKFDVEITNEDLMSINYLRHSMSKVISVALNKKSEGNGPAEGISELRIAVKNEFLKIIQKKRRSSSSHGINEQWRQYDSSFYFQIPRDAHNDVFGRHTLLKTKEGETARVMMADHLKKIKELVDGNSIANDYNSIECKLCDESFSGKLGLRMHLFSADHFKREIDFSSYLK